MVTVMHTFADHAVALRRAGWAVLPANGKKPALAGFPSWRRAPGPEIISGWAQAHPDANIAYVAGCCSGKPGQQGIIAVDADDEEAMGQAEEIFGQTPGKIQTRRGAHFLYAAGDITLGNVSSLRSLGLNIDLKHGQHGSAIGILPPSVHEKEASFHYSWLGCDETVLRHLPLFQVHRLLQKSLSEGAATKGAPTKRAGKPREWSDQSGFRGGSRGLGLNDHLVSQVPSCDTFDDLLDAARTWNGNLIDHCRGHLEDDEVVRWAKSVWKDHGERPFLHMIAQGGVALITRAEMAVLDGHKGDGDALRLLLKLKLEHSARCRRGETFALDVTAMVEAEVLPGWKWERYQKAKKLLLSIGLLKCVSEFQDTKGGRRAAQFTLG